MKKLLIPIVAAALLGTAHAEFIQTGRDLVSLHSTVQTWYIVGVHDGMPNECAPAISASTLSTQVLSVLRENPNVLESPAQQLVKLAIVKLYGMCTAKEAGILDPKENPSVHQLSGKSI